MKIKVYVDWFEREIISKKELKEKVEEATKNYTEDKYFFDDWLNEHYSADEIWNFNEEQRKEVLSDFLVRCEELALKNVLADWSQQEIEV